MGDPIRDASIEAITTYFASGIKPESKPLKLGLELEHTIVDAQGNPVPYSGDAGIRWVLERLSETFPVKTIDAKGNLLGVSRCWQAVTIEPAAQVELSAGPYENVGQIRIEFEEFQRNLAHILAEKDYRLLAVGYHPTAKAESLELIPKERYRFMDEHFRHTGTLGHNMMRATGSAQVSIDYRSIDDCLRKLRLASGIAPLMALVCDNAPTFEGAPRTGRMVRTRIWRDTDPARCGLVPGVMESDFTLERYAAYVLDTPAIFFVDDSGASRATNATFAELHANKPMEVKDVEHALSLLFNDVRLKTYVEIRPADAMPIPFATAYAALVKALFYTDPGLAFLDDLLDGATADDVEQATVSLMEQGYDATVHGKTAGTILDEMLEVAHDALEQNERNYLGPLELLITRRTTLADMAAEH